VFNFVGAVMKARYFWWLGVALLLLPLTSLAQQYGRHGSDAAGRLVELQVVDRASYQSLPLYRWRSMQFVAGELGSPYSLRLTNKTGQRVMVVLAVDGINVLSGKNAAAHPSDGGYVLGPWETAEVAGWRKSMNQVAQFYFTRPGNSYAGQTGRRGQVGVIGAAVFQEAYVRPPVTIQRSEDAAGMPAPSAPAMEKQQSSRSAGTGHGRNEWSPVQSTHFRAISNTPVETIRIDYDTPDGLVSRGIRLEQSYYDRPRTFPGGFVPDP
jgi:hypothetical protein